MLNRYEGFTDKSWEDFACPPLSLQFYYTPDYIRFPTDVSTLPFSGQDFVPDDFVFPNSWANA